MPMLNLQDLIWTCTQRYREGEAVEEAAVTTISAEESDSEEDWSADGIRLQFKSGKLLNLAYKWELFTDFNRSKS